MDRLLLVAVFHCDLAEEGQDFLSTDSWWGLMLNLNMLKLVY